MKKLLIISYCYPPVNDPSIHRPYALDKYIDKEKFDVTVLTYSNPDSSLGFDKELERVKLITIKSISINKTQDVKNLSMHGKRQTFVQKIN